MAGFGGSTGVSKEYVDRAIAQSTAYSEARYNNFPQTCVYKVGRICFITCIAGNWYCSGNGAIRYNSATAAEWIVPAGFRPVQNCEIREAYGGKRLTVGTDGQVTSIEALSGVPLRFSACYICAE